MRKIPHSLIDNLELQEKSHAELLELLGKEAQLKPSFNSASLHELENLQADKLRLIESLKTLDESRQAMILKLSQEWGETEELNISALIQRAADSDAAKLRQRQTGLKETIKKISELGRQTSEISKARLGTFRQLSDTLHGLVPSSGTYALSGKIKKTARPRLISQNV